MSNNFVRRCKKAFVLVGGGIGSASLLALLTAEASVASAHQIGSVEIAQRVASPGDPNQVPTARYARGEAVDLSLIVEEWRSRYPATPVFACTCTASSCGDAAVWPFRTFTLYQPFVALGKFNAANNEASGFNCFDMETGDRPSD